MRVTITFQQNIFSICYFVTILTQVRVNNYYQLLYDVLFRASIKTGVHSSSTVAPNLFVTVNENKINFLTGIKDIEKEKI